MSLTANPSPITDTQPQLTYSLLHWKQGWLQIPLHFLLQLQGGTCSLGVVRHEGSMGMLWGELLQLSVTPPSLGP